MKSLLILTAAGLLSAATVAIAAPEGRGMDRLRAADTNGDGMISREEAQALPRLAKHFDEIDADHNGQITPEEMRARHDKARAAHWKKIDADGDGRISKAEAQANAPRLFEHFEQIDANKDGFITPDEMKAAHGKRHAAK
jgi:Ca2+-binding EF-hand superfamily protein